MPHQEPGTTPGRSVYLHCLARRDRTWTQEVWNDPWKAKLDLNSALTNPRAHLSEPWGGGSQDVVPPRRQWLTPVILATQEAEIRRIAV
jgi:hypothetical protein